MNEMNNINYQCKYTPTFATRILLKSMKLMKMKSKTANMLTYVANILPIRPHNRLIRNFDVKFFYQNGKNSYDDFINEKTSRYKTDRDEIVNENIISKNVNDNKINYKKIDNKSIDYKKINNSKINNKKIEILDKLNIEILKRNNKGRKVWVISRKGKEAQFVILYLHGGSYILNITIQHWRFIEMLAKRINATFIVPDYPLAPKYSCKDTYDLMDRLYENILSIYPDKRIIFMGDSAGGGLALGFAQKIKNEWKRNPEKIMLFSPWLDVTMENPYINLIDKYDVMLNVEGLKKAGKLYAGDFDLKDYRVSPIYGNFENLGEISIFTGTHDVLYADIIRLKSMLKEKNIEFNYFEYPCLFHDFMIFTNLVESHDVIKKVQSILLENKYSF
ncbi:MAG: alpha/beta hydrolase [Spirochaetota bacterium]